MIVTGISGLCDRSALLEGFSAVGRQWHRRSGGRIVGNARSGQHFWSSDTSVVWLVAGCCRCGSGGCERCMHVRCTRPPLSMALVPAVHLPSSSLSAAHLHLFSQPSTHYHVSSLFLARSRTSSDSVCARTKSCATTLRCGSKPVGVPTEASCRPTS